MTVFFQRSQAQAFIDKFNGQMSETDTEIDSTEVVSEVSFLMFF